MIHIPNDYSCLVFCIWYSNLGYYHLSSAYTSLNWHMHGRLLTSSHSDRLPWAFAPWKRTAIRRKITLVPWFSMVHSAFLQHSQIDAIFISFGQA